MEREATIASHSSVNVTDVMSERQSRPSSQCSVSTQLTTQDPNLSQGTYNNTRVLKE